MHMRALNRSYWRWIRLKYDIFCCFSIVFEILILIFHAKIKTLWAVFSVKLVLKSSHSRAQSFLKEIDKHYLGLIIWVLMGCFSECFVQVFSQQCVASICGLLIDDLKVCAFFIFFEFVDFCGFLGNICWSWVYIYIWPWNRIFWSQV